MKRFNKIDPLPRSVFAFCTSLFTVKRYGMKEYPFLFAPNTATAENNTSLGHGFSSDRSHNTRSSQSGFNVTNYTRPIPFRQVPWLDNGFSNFYFPPLKIPVLTKNKNFCATCILLRSIQKVALSKNAFGGFLALQYFFSHILAFYRRWFLKIY